MADLASLTTGSPGAAIDTSSATNKDLPAWYQQYTQNLGSQAMGIAQGNNSQPLPAQSVAGFNKDQPTPLPMCAATRSCGNRT